MTFIPKLGSLKKKENIRLFFTLEVNDSSDYCHHNYGYDCIPQRIYARCGKRGLSSSYGNCARRDCIVVVISTPFGIELVCAGSVQERLEGVCTVGEGSSAYGNGCAVV